jgi:hypothetical protein
VLIDNSSKGISKEQLGNLVNGYDPPQPNLFDLGIIPIIPQINLLPEKFIVIPTRIRYPPNGFNLSHFLDLIVELSKIYSIVLIGERKLDKENREIFTIYDQITQHLNIKNVIFTDFTSNTNLYKGESKLDHLWLDLNIVHKSQFVLTFGISGLIDLCSYVNKVHTVGEFKRPHTKLIWNNPTRFSLVRSMNISDMRKKILGIKK